MDAKTRRWQRRPEGSTWGDWGAEDQLGRLNLITPRKVKEGIAEVREGLSFCLSLPLDLPGSNLLNPRRFPPRLQPTRAGEDPIWNRPATHLHPQATDVICDDAALLHLQYSTQWDSFAHVGSWFDLDGSGTPVKCYYNGYRADDFMINPAGPAPDGGAVGARRLGIETFAEKAIQGRAVLIDLYRIAGRERRKLKLVDVMAALAHAGAVVEPGDMLVCYTGFGDLLLERAGKPTAEELHSSCAVLDGNDRDLLQWITDSQISALIADNYGVESAGVPHQGCDSPHAVLPLHEHCLFKLGVPLGELWNLGALARWLAEKRRARFLLTAPPLRLPGAVGSPVTPVATV